jgi:dehydrogenase/reductase SDR family protein 12
VRQLVKELQNMEDRVDCLVCNAGALLNDRKETKEGNEVTIATHLLGGTYLLSSLLMPQLKKSGKEARIVFIGSGGMYNSKFPSWPIAASTDPGYKYDGNMAYAYAKRGQVCVHG